MKKAIETKREKLKWLTALCLCLTCFSLCLSLLARPTYADAPGFLEELERVSVMRWDDSNCGNKKDSTGETHGMSYTVGNTFTGPGTLCWVKYRLDKKFVAISGKLACADSSTPDAAMRLKIYNGDDELIYTSEPILWGEQAIPFSANISGLDAMRMELVQVDVPGGPVLPLDETSCGYALLIYPLLTRVPPPTTAPDPSSSSTTTPDTSASSTTAPDSSSSSTLPVMTYRAVEGWTNLYRQYSSADLGGPFIYVFSFSGKPETDRTPVYVKDGKYYFEVLKSNVYLALRQNGMFDIDDAIWAGPDKIFDTADDKAAVLRAGSLFFEEKPGEWKFLVSRYDYVDSRWANSTYPTTTSTTTTGATGTIETTTNGFLTTRGDTMPPKTGVPFNAGLLVCVAVLFMGCLYCGYRLTRKERA